MKKKRRRKDPERCDEVCESCLSRFACRKRVMLGYERLAFGSTADAFRLIMSTAEESCDVGELDLFNVAEIKKPKDGAMEIKFFDRLKALDQLREIPENGDSAAAFYEAITACADGLKGGSDSSEG